MFLNSEAVMFFSIGLILLKEGKGDDLLRTRHQHLIS